MSQPPPDQALALIRRFRSELVTEDELLRRLEEAAAKGERLRVKFGIDPTFTDVHLGHSVPIRLLRLFQDFGHLPILLLGDATARLGDPTGRNDQRPPLSKEDVEHNAATYLEQIGQVLDLNPKRCELRRNSEWFGAMDFFDSLRLLGRGTVARLLERDDFRARIDQSQPIHLHEMMYPLMQGWDSVMLKADVELGGNDQLFNLHMGRLLQEREGQRPQVCLTTPLLLGTDGRKMSKTYGNHVPLNGEPEDVYGKVMSLGDEPMVDWFRLATSLEGGEIEAVLASHPREAKGRLAWEIVAGLQGAEVADAAAEKFTNQFKHKQLPADIPEVVVSERSLALPNLLQVAGLCQSTSEARRMIRQGGVRIEGEVEHDMGREVALSAEGDGTLVQVGKRKFARIKQG
ncbi:MAG: tyrosine--tRNA ligase [Planctomycetes bacterium]|nr:tyrosine--tRNA ligase [Planctomycetota bacterium]